MAWCYKKSHEHNTLRYVGLQMSSSDVPISLRGYILLHWRTRRWNYTMLNCSFVGLPIQQTSKFNWLIDSYGIIQNMLTVLQNLLPLTVGQSSRGINTSFSGLSAREWSIRMASARARRSKYCSVSWDDMFSSDLVSCESQAGACSATNSRSG